MNEINFDRYRYVMAQDTSRMTPYFVNQVSAWLLLSHKRPYIHNLLIARMTGFALYTFVCEIVLVPLTNIFKIFFKREKGR